MNARNAIIFAVFVVAAILRFYDLGGESLWNDELSTWKRANQESITEVIRLVAETDIHPPGYQIFIYGWISVFGDSEFSLRFPSALAGILSVWFMFLLGKREFGSIAGLFSAWLMAISWYPIYYSQEARAYSIMLMLVLMVMLLLEKISEASLARKISLVLTLFGLSYLHYFGSYFVGLVVLLSLVHNVNRRFWLKILGILIIVATPWIPSAFNQIGGGAVYIQKMHFFDLLRWVKMVFSSSALFLIVILFLIGASFLVLRKSTSQIFALIRPLFWILIIWLPMWIVSAIWIPILTFPNMIIGLPFLLILVAGSVQTIDASGRVMTIISVLYSMIALNNMIIDKNYYGSPQKQQFRESVLYVIQENYHDEFPIYGYVWDVDYLHYYSSRIADTRFEEFPDSINKIESTQFWLIEAHRILPDSINSQLSRVYYTSMDSQFVGARARKFILK